MSARTVLSGATVGAVKEMMTETAALPPIEAEIVADCAVEIVPVVTVNLADVTPDATVTEAGTLSAAALSARVIFCPPDGAALERVTVQVVLAFDPKLGEAHCKDEIEEIGAGAVNIIAALDEEPFRVAVMEAVWPELIVLVLAVKDAELALTTRTVAGTVRAVELLTRVTVTPSDEVALERLTMQVVLAFCARLDAAHWSEEICTVVTRAIEVFADELFSFAVIVAV